MKKLHLLFVSLLLSFFAQAQLPDKAENISPLLIGESVPNITLTSTDGKSILTSALFQEKPTIAVFYRGGWCPYCNKQLAELAKMESDILAMGYQIVAISPDAPASLKATMGKNELKYQLYSDSKGELMKAIGIAFQAPERAKPYIEKGSEGINKDMLPVPTVLVLDKTGLILFEYISPNYQKRMSGQMLMAVLKSIAIPQ